MSSVTVTELKNQVTVSTTENTIEVKSPGTIGSQGSAGEILSTTETATAVPVDGNGNSQDPTVSITLGGTTAQRTMAFAFGLPTGKSGVVQSVAVSTANGLKINGGTSHTANVAVNSLAFTINEQELWTSILDSNVTGTALTVTDGSSSTNLPLESTVTIQGTSNEVEVSNSSGTFTVGLPANPIVSGVTAGNVKVGVTGDNEIDTSSGNLTIDSAGGTTTVDDHLIVSGDLTVSGSTTTVNTETINLADNIILINSNATGSPSQDGGIEIERGSSTNKTFVWSESADKWTVGSETLVAGTFEGALNGNASTVTNGVYTQGDQTIAGVKTFSSTIVGSINGNSATVTNGVYTTGNQTIAGTKTFSSDIVGNLDGNVTGNLTGQVSTATQNSITSIPNLVTVGTISSGIWNGTAIALGTYTSGNYVGTVTAGTGLTSTGATSGEGIAHSLSVDASQTQITAVGTIATGVWQGTAVADSYIASATTWNNKISATGVTYENLNSNSDVGTGASQVAQGNHNHSALYDPLGSSTAMAIALG